MDYCVNCIGYNYCSARRMCINPPFGYCTRYQPKRMSPYSSTMSTGDEAKDIVAILKRDSTNRIVVGNKEFVLIVTRCRDCIHYDEPEWTCLLHGSNMKPTDFCSYGEINEASGERNNH